MKASLNWVASVSPNIVLQSLKVDLNSVRVVDESLDPSTSNFNFEVKEGDEIHVELRVSNGILVSDPEILDTLAPVKPASTTDLTISFSNE